MTRTHGNRKGIYLQVTHLLFLLAACGSEGGSENPTTSPVGGLACADTTTDGQATFYDADGTGACSFTRIDGPPMVVALGDPDYQGANTCGACLSVQGPLGEITVQVVDRCPECEQGHIDLSREAFEQIADPVDGIVPVSWTIVTCNVDTSVEYHFKDGSSEFWTAVQVRNHTQPVQSFEYQNVAGEWVELPRQNYNFFLEDEGMGSGPFAFRLTDSSGNRIEDQGIELGNDETREGSQQFPPCSN